MLQNYSGLQQVIFNLHFFLNKKDNTIHIFYMRCTFEIIIYRIKYILLFDFELLKKKTVLLFWK